MFLSNQREAFRGLALMSQLSLQLLIPILIGVAGGIWLDGISGWSPWCVLIGTIIGIAAAFRNLYVWSVRQIHRSENSERTQKAIRELGLGNKQAKEKSGGGNE